MYRQKLIEKIQDKMHRAQSIKEGRETVKTVLDS